MSPASRYSSAELVHMADQLVAFRAKLEELLEHTFEMVGDASLRVWRMPLDGHEAECRALRDEVSMLAGGARVGIEAADATALRLDRPTGDQYVLNPVAGWAAIMSPGAMFRADEILDTTRLAEGKLRADALAARRDEQSLAGRIAAIISIPNRVRELAGFNRDSRAGKVTQVTVAAALVSLLVAVVGGVITAVVVAVLRIGQ